MSLCVCALLGLYELAQSGGLWVLHNIAYLHFDRRDDWFPERMRQEEGVCVKRGLINTSKCNMIQ